jgi:hypothetical protein
MKKLLSRGKDMINAKRYVDGHTILSLSLSLSLNFPLTLHLPLLRHLIDDPYFGQRLKVGLDRDDFIMIKSYC